MGATKIYKPALTFCDGRMPVIATNAQCTSSLVVTEICPQIRVRNP